MNNDPIQNPGDKHYRDEFDYVKRAEANSASDSSTPRSSSATDSRDINDLENNGNWINNTTNKPGKSRINGKGKFLKAKGPTALIITFVLSALSFVGFIGSPALLTQNILANLVQKLNIQETSLDIRVRKLTYSKISEDTTKGVCGVKINILCKYSRPSNKLLRNLKKNGIEALDEDGNVIEGKGILPNARPAKYRFNTGSGEDVEVEAKDFSSKLASDPEFRAAFHDAYNPRFISVIDSVFSKIKTKFGFSTDDKLKESTDEANATKEIDDESRAIDNDVDTASKNGADEVKTVVKDETTEEMGDVTKAAKVGGLIQLSAAGICIAKDIPGLITKAARAFQMAQLIKYSMVFLSTFGSIKAGDATPTEVSAVGDVLTKVVGGKSAMDSFGMKYAITGDTVPTTTNYKKYAPGGNVISALGTFTEYADSNITTNACALATSPATGVLIDAAVGGASLGIGDLINAVGGLALSKVAEVVLPPLLSAVISHIPINDILKLFMGDLTQNLSGENVGDALTSGASHVMGQTGNSGGNVPLSVSEAVAYNNVTQEVQLAYAKEDQATKSPFDVSSQNTFMGSIVNQLMPYYLNSGSTFGSISNIFATAANLASNSLGVIYKSSSLYAAAASNDTSQYQLCDDPAIKNNDIAAGPYCNIIYGVPVEYLNTDAVTVLNYMIDNKYIDEDTGDPITDSSKGSTDYSDWIATCNDGTTKEAANCKIANQKYAFFSLYTIDHRAEKSMDEDD